MIMHQERVEIAIAVLIEAHGIEAVSKAHVLRDGVPIDRHALGAQPQQSIIAGDALAEGYGCPHDEEVGHAVAVEVTQAQVVHVDRVSLLRGIEVGPTLLSPFTARLVGARPGQCRPR